MPLTFGRAPVWLGFVARCVLLLLAVAMLLIAGLMAMASPAQAQVLSVPREALAHKLTLRREAHRIWGLNAPIAVFAAQVHQESRWRIGARSPVGAQGLAQFMPSTAQWIGGIDPELSARAPGNPTWSLRALVVYDLWLWQRIKPAANDCERMAFALASYNGGLGWVIKRQRLSPAPGICLGQTCQLNPGISTANQAENEHYPRVILLKHQALYRTWGPGLCNQA